MQRAFLALVLCTAACADVGIRVDGTGLGNAPIGNFLKTHWNYSDKYIASAIPIELDGSLPSTPTPEIVAASIESFGFHCRPYEAATDRTDLTCSYDGFVVTQVVEFFGNTAIGRPIRPPNNIKFHVEIAWSSANPTLRTTVTRSST
jgi:hypothetical protein